MTASRHGRKVLLMLALCLVAVEAVCQLYAWRLGRKLEAIRASPDHYYRASRNPTLAYELMPGYAAVKEDRRLRINRLGLRDDADEAPAGVDVVALLGDSVVFGTGFSQDETLSALMQAALDPSTSAVRVVNFGVPGYNLDEIAEQLREKNAVYRADRIVYLLNPNDFCRRDTVYEGADNGLYRMYRRPRLKTPWFARKAVYRLHKRGYVSVPWYRWIYAGNREHAFGVIEGMARYGTENGARFVVVLLPAGSAYADGGYELADLYADLSRQMESMGIPCTGPVAAFMEDHERLFTDTDHLTPEGNRRMADELARLVRLMETAP